MAGYITEILPDGNTSDLVPNGLNWPLGLAMGNDGALYVADGACSYRLRPGGKIQLAGMLFTKGYPGYARGVAASGPGEFIITTGTGTVARYWPDLGESEVLATGFDQLYGVASAPDGTIIFAESGTGRVHSTKSGSIEQLGTDLSHPTGVTVGPDGLPLVAESGAGRVVKLSGGKTEIVLDGLQNPQGVLIQGRLLYVVDAASKELVEYDLASGARRNIAFALPVGAPAGVVPKYIGPIGNLSGPMGAFADIAAGTDGTLFISADAEGSVLAIRPG
jgi:sugar lactone lactonase YvrE